MKIGSAETIVSPDRDLPLWGYGGRTGNSKGIHDNLYARAFLFDSQKRFLLITLDMGAVDYTFCKNASDRISKTTDIEPAATAINCSHTHSAPSVMPVRGLEAD